MKISKKNIIIIGAIIVIAAVASGTFWFFTRSKPASLFSVEAKNEDITEKINLTGQVKASEGVDLAFEVAGKIVLNNVKVGDKIYAGQPLASLNNSALLAQLNSAKAGLESAQANYDKLLAGAKSQDINISKVSVDSAKQNLLTKINSAFDSSYNILTNVTSAMFTDPASNNSKLTINGVTFNNQQLYFKINDERTKLIILTKTWQDQVSASDTNSDLNKLSTDALTNLNAVNSYLTDLVSMFGYYSTANNTTSQTTLTASQTAVSTSLSANNASILDVNTANSALNQSQAALDFKTAPPTQNEIDSAKAQIDSANANIQSIQAQISKTVITSLFDGKVDKDSIIVGSIAVPGAPMITISNNNLEIDTYIPEVDLGKVKLSSKANITLDAYSSSDIFLATVISIDTAPSLVNGISTYGAKLKFDNSDDRIKTGMTASINIISDSRKNVLSVPRSAVIQKNSQYFVIIDKGNSQTELRQVTIGLKDESNIEITSGLKLGEKVLAY